MHRQGKGRSSAVGIRGASDPRQSVNRLRPKRSCRGPSGASGLRQLVNEGLRDFRMLA